MATTIKLDRALRDRVDQLALASVRLRGVRTTVQPDGFPGHACDLEPVAELLRRSAFDMLIDEGLLPPDYKKAVYVPFDGVLTIEPDEERQ